MNVISITLFLWTSFSSSWASKCRCTISCHILRISGACFFYLQWNWAGSRTEAGSNPTAGSEMWSSLLGKTQDHGIWQSLGKVQTTDRNQSASSPRTQNWAGVKRQDSKNGSQGSSLFYQPELLIESSRNLRWLYKAKRGFIIRWLGTCEIDWMLENLA